VERKNVIISFYRSRDFYTDLTSLIEAAEKVCIDNEGKKLALLMLRGTNY